MGGDDGKHPTSAIEDAIEFTGAIELPDGKVRIWRKVLLVPGLWGQMLPRVRMQILMGGVCFSNYLIRVALGTCAVQMVNEYGWDVQAKGMLLGAFFWGYLAGNLFAGVLAARYGASLTLAAAAVLWSCLAIAVPLAADMGFSHLWLLLTFLGLAASPVLATSSALIAAAVPASERGRCLAGRALAFRFGSIVATVATPWLCMHIGWRAVFLVFGIFSFLLGLMWLAFAPAMAMKVAGEVLEADNGAATQQSTQGAQRTLAFLPWHVLRHPGFAALLATHCSHNFSVYTIMSWGPSYFTEALQTPLEVVGLYLLAPAIAQGAGAVIGGIVMDKLQTQHMPLLVLRRRIICPAALVAAAGLVGFGLARDAVSASLSITVAKLGVGVLDTAVNAVYLDIAPASTASVVSVGNCIATLPGALGPAMVAALLRSTGLWFMVWSSIAGCLVVSGVLFAFWGSVDDMDKEGEKAKSGEKSKYMHV
mmetsp:Transcript_91667/g.163147  ORF Transcript_91667/g.163147 Transcript_91667/m.163147 type:complete len:479 (+) Transcript_91667:46-1482(+)